MITGGAGGVGSILIQLARRLTGLTVIATATRPESQKWCLDLGAHAVIDHGQPMKAQIEALKLPPVALVASLTFTDQHYKAIADFMAPQGKFGLIDDPPEFTMSAFKGKAISVHWESMFTRSSFQTPDMIGQHMLLNDVADLIDKVRAAHHARPDLWDDQRRQLETRACAAGERQIARQDRAGGLVGIRRVGKGAPRRAHHSSEVIVASWWARFRLRSLSYGGQVALPTQRSSIKKSGAPRRRF